ncbi:hypothetical protein A2Z67_03800 [Candidatus Woesebacteria bacterium RBG_13_36_22]|uniref:Uncharacterized protein n=1 Tax=Candidatus Woesebacteria bacterium RBG_13_36_22 TaxID=1802478 RepID=A0A1F7X285_9BACT|nr:MAG: hypothetical protein A2Z67_03800 [Candidatus Woesebacteria bacterium RBG_13_36_22]
MASNFNQKITRIKGLSDRRRLPRLDSIRLGIKKKSAKTGAEYPCEVDYFVVPDKIKEIYGDKPISLDVMIPINEIDAVFPAAYKYYGSSRGLICQGNGEKAYRVNAETKEMEDVECPCEHLESGKCKQSATLMVILPKVSVGGVYQIRTSSFNSIVDIQSGLDYISALLGRFAMVPLTLRRVKTETHHDDKKQHHYTLQITFDGDINTLNQLRSDTQRVLEHPRYQLPAPKDDNPEFDPVDIVDMENELTEEDLQVLDFKDKVNSYIPALKRPGIMSVLEAFGYKEIESIPIDKREEFLKLLESALN